MKLDLLHVAEELDRLRAALEQAGLDGPFDPALSRELDRVLAAQEQLGEALAAIGRAIGGEAA